MNFKSQIVDILNNDPEIENWMYYEPTRENTIQNLKSEGISYQEEDSFGGEGQGDQYWSVFSFSKEGEETLYVRFYGWYTSYNGAEYEGYKFVKPYEKVITVYN